MRRKLALFGIAVLLLGVAACGPIYSDAPGPPIPPTVVGMEWSHPGDAHSLDCGLGILADGSAFVSGALGHPFLAAGITWLGYEITGEAYPPGGSIVACWNYAQWNIHAFNLYTQCYGQPVLKSTWTSFSGAQAWVSIPTCRQCNQACVAFANIANPLFRYKASYCDNPAFQLDLVCFALAHPVNGAAMTDNPAANDIPAGTTTDIPWDPSMVPPAWDVNTPIPQ
jgi:hypothetical protein